MNLVNVEKGNVNDVSSDDVTSCVYFSFQIKLKVYISGMLTTGARAAHLYCLCKHTTHARLQTKRTFASCLCAAFTAASAKNSDLASAYNISGSSVRVSVGVIYVQHVSVYEKLCVRACVRASSLSINLCWREIGFICG